jgi:uncharacterized protein YbjT (DUF2867 family)
MNVLIFGATGMVGQGVLRECLLAADVKRVLTVGRNATGVRDPKLHEIVHIDLRNYSNLEPQLKGYDACLFCLGVSSIGMTQAAYEQITYEITLAAAETLVRLNPGMVFTYVSGMGTDSTEQGRSMWARVKGRTENALLRMPFRGAYMFRPGAIESAHGERSKTKAYRAFSTLGGWVLPMLRKAFPRHIVTTEQMGKAMLVVARRGAPQHILQPADIYNFATMS